MLVSQVRVVLVQEPCLTDLHSRKYDYSTVSIYLKELTKFIKQHRFNRFQSVLMQVSSSTGKVEDENLLGKMKIKIQASE